MSTKNIISEARYAFTPQQLDDLFAIANQCPLLGGEGVYKARAMYALISNATYIDDDLCAAAGVSLRITKPADTLEEPRLLIYPNPVENTIYLEYPESLSGIFLYNSLGQLILEKTGFDLGGFVSLDVSKIPYGIYQIKATTLSGTQISRLVSIIK